ncbi:MAG: DNA adenine methylase [Oscillospiraceae bacterium]|nr:DNA adenine methylase [Oscillospiraceae bacterium]
MLVLDSIRYMGIKTKLLDKIIPEVISVTPTNGIVCDIMSGSNVVSYALKEHFTVYTNDIQKYSQVISDAVIKNQTASISSQEAEASLSNYVEENLQKRIYTFFEDTYSQTYFSKQQCQHIDSIRYAIDKVSDADKKSLFLFALMCAMCKVQSTPGHFAQFMPSTHKRIIPLQQMNLWEEFKTKCDNYKNVYLSNKQNKSFCMDFKDLIDSGEIDNVDTIYLDSPYSQEQYSRFYHILETLVKYDYPEVAYKAKYRTDRFMSGFCTKKKAASEFEYIFNFCKKHSINIVISYSTNALVPTDELISLCKKYFSEIKYQEIDHKHSTQGKGNNSIKEIIISGIHS